MMPPLQPVLAVQPLWRTASISSLHLLSHARAAGAWNNILHRATPSVLALTNQSLLFLAWPPRPARLETALTLAVITFTDWAWETRNLPSTILHVDIQPKIGLAAGVGPFSSIF
jgi:hypothetical protein